MRRATPARHLVVLALAGLIAGAGIVLIRRLARSRAWALVWPGAGADGAGVPARPVANASV